MKQKLLLGVISLILIMLISCKHDSNSEYPAISLSKSELLFECFGGENIVKLTTNGNWTASRIPDWLSLSHTSGSESHEITVKVEVNNDIQGREAKILFVNESETVALNIVQSASKREMAFSSLRFSSFDKVTFALGENGIERTYSFSTLQQFVNPSVNPEINKKIYLGNLINQQLADNNDIVEYKGYTYKPITIFSSIGKEMSKEIIPSKEEQEAYVDRIISKRPSQSEHFIYDGTGVLFNSYRELSLIGRGNMGLKLDEIISGKSYQEQEMQKKNGVVFSFSHTLLTLDMDIQEHIVEEEISKKDFPDNNISYVSSVSYGRIGLLIIESDYDVSKVRKMVKRIMQNNFQELSQEEKSIANEITAYHLFIDKSLKMQMTKGKMDVVEAYKMQITTDLFNVYPFKYKVSDCFKPEEVSITFNITIP